MDERTFRSGGVGEPDFKLARLAAPLRHCVVETIRNSIAAGRFRAGERLPERDLCEMTGVSRTLVREALRQLESEGLIEVLPQRGPIVARVGPEQAEGVYQVRQELEGLAAQLFASRAGDAERKALREAFRHLKAAAVSKDPLVRVGAKNRFYECLIGGSGNEAVGLALRLLNSRIAILRATSLQTPGRARQSIEELGVLVDALLARDPVAARAAAVHHVVMAGAAAVAQLRAAQEETAQQAPPPPT